MMKDSSMIFGEIFTSGMFLVFNILLNHRKKTELKNYLKMLFLKWKIISFLIAILSLSILSFYANDPTWDVGVSLVMGASTFLFAPYSVFCFYESINFKKMSFRLLNSIFFLVFSAGWTYDIYNYFKNGHVPNAWFESLILSSIVYVTAGIFWNLAEKNGRPFLAINNSNWPSVYDGIGVRTFMKCILPIAILVSVFFLLFNYIR